MAKGQREFPGMPERSKLGKKAIEYLNQKDELENKKTEIDKTKAELVELFLATGKKSIKVDGTIVSYAHMEKDQIKTRHANG